MATSAVLERTTTSGFGQHGDINAAPTSRSLRKHHHQRVWMADMIHTRIQMWTEAIYWSFFFLDVNRQERAAFVCPRYSHQQAAAM
mmetsp:Transcript_68829/g.100792  ORF Transcript_68829/g.100792 Transcript_68829/m.100792 type:complete len:86 (+) Transcript_68829:277-534(+)